MFGESGAAGAKVIVRVPTSKVVTPATRGSMLSAAAGTAVPSHVHRRGSSSVMVMAVLSATPSAFAAGTVAATWLETMSPWPRSRRIRWSVDSFWML